MSTKLTSLSPLSLLELFLCSLILLKWLAIYLITHTYTTYWAHRPVWTHSVVCMYMVHVFMNDDLELENLPRKLPLEKTNSDSLSSR